MKAHATQILQDQFAGIHDDLDVLVSEFERWKDKGAAGEYSSYFFGKDSAYIDPKVNGAPYTLRHVHLAPITQAKQIAKWNRDWLNKSRKTSDRVLVYVSNSNGEALLIFILPEPDAHEIARMKTPQDKALMNSFSEIADAFLNTGQIIA